MPIDNPDTTPEPDGGGGGGVDSGGGTTPPAPPACDLALVSVTPYPPTSPGGFGYAIIAYSSSNPAPVQCTAVNLTLFTYHYAPAPGFTASSGQLTNLLPGSYSFDLRQGDTCVATGNFVLKDAAPPPDPSLGKPARWEPVGGVLPNPVLLDVEALLTTPAGLPRAGLHVELELWRPATVAAFATFRATVRTAAQQVDAAPYLRSELVAAARYPGSSASPFIDEDGSLSFFYRYRIVDATGPEPWAERASQRYGVLAALPQADDTMLPYVADGTGRVASVFADDEATQFLSMPLEVSVLLPPATIIRWAEMRYLDAYGQELEIRSFELAPSMPAGYLRIPLPSDPLLLAASVEVAIVDTDRSYSGGSGTAPSGGYLLTNTGRLQL